MHKSLIVIFFVFVLAGCDDRDTSPLCSAVGPVALRIMNNGSLPFDKVYVNTSGGEYDFGRISPLQSSDYAGFDIIYSFAYIRVHCNNKDYTIQPIDYVGETAYKSGCFTYKLEISNLESSYGLSVDLERD